MPSVPNLGLEPREVVQASASKTLYNIRGCRISSNNLAFVRRNDHRAVKSIFWTLYVTCEHSSRMMGRGRTRTSLSHPDLFRSRTCAGAVAHHHAPHNRAGRNRTFFCEPSDSRKTKKQSAVRPRTAALKLEMFSLTNILNLPSRFCTACGAKILFHLLDRFAELTLPNVHPSLINLVTQMSTQGDQHFGTLLKSG